MPHINLIHPYVKETEFKKEEYKIAQHLSQIKPFTISLTKESFGHFTHGKSSTIWVKPVDGAISSNASQTHQQVAAVIKPQYKEQMKSKRAKSPKKKVMQTVKKMVKKVCKINFVSNFNRYTKYTSEYFIYWSFITTPGWQNHYLLNLHIKW